MRFRSSTFIVIALLAVTLSLSACGKKGSPEPVPGGNYPTTYPTR